MATMKEGDTVYFKSEIDGQTYWQKGIVKCINDITVLLVYWSPFAQPNYVYLTVDKEDVFEFYSQIQIPRP